jgi:hypothetical protein
MAPKEADMPLPTIKPMVSESTGRILMWVSWLLLLAPVVIMAILANAPEGSMPWWVAGTMTALSTAGGAIKAILPAQGGKVDDQKE